VIQKVHAAYVAVGEKQWLTVADRGQGLFSLSGFEKLD
jgi:hypothetical protein